MPAHRLQQGRVAGPASGFERPHPPGAQRHPLWPTACGGAAPSGRRRRRGPVGRRCRRGPVGRRCRARGSRRPADAGAGTLGPAWNHRPKRQRNPWTAAGRPRRTRPTRRPLRRDSVGGASWAGAVAARPRAGRHNGSTSCRSGVVSSDCGPAASLGKRLVGRLADLGPTRQVADPLAQGPPLLGPLGVAFERSVHLEVPRIADQRLHTQHRNPCRTSSSELPLSQCLIRTPSRRSLMLLLISWRQAWGTLPLAGTAGLQETHHIDRRERGDGITQQARVDRGQGFRGREQDTSLAHSPSLTDQ